MEDITKYIGLLGFVPLVILVAFIFGCYVVGIFYNYDDSRFREALPYIILCSFGFIVTVGGLIWGITTLGRLL